MAGIETLTGVTKVNAFEYEVTAEVSVGSGIDDLEYATPQKRSAGTRPAQSERGTVSG